MRGYRSLLSGSELGAKEGDVVTNQANGLEPVLLNDFRRQWAEVGDEVLAATRRVGESGWYILGQEVKAFERDLAVFTKRRCIAGCANGLDAIEIGLRALGIQPGDRVLTTPLSAFATTLAIVRAGGVPVFVDVDEFGLLDLAAVRQQLDADSTIRFLVPVHLFGHAVDLAALADIKQQFGLKIIEDCCQAVGAQSGSVSVGSVGEMSALSFYPTKNLGAFGDGGAVMTDDTALDTQARALRDYGQSSRYCHDVLGLNSRLDELHAAVLRTALLPRLAAWTSRRQAVAQAYLAGIHHPELRVPGAPERSVSVWHLFPVLVENGKREHFRAHLDSLRVSTAIHYPELISRQAALKASSFDVARSLPWADRYCKTEVSLPIHPQMTDSEIERVITGVNCWRSP